MFNDYLLLKILEKQKKVCEIDYLLGDRFWPRSVEITPRKILRNFDNKSKFLSTKWQNWSELCMKTKMTRITHQGKVSLD